MPNWDNCSDEDSEVGPVVRTPYGFVNSEEHRSVVEDPKLTNSSFDEALELSPAPASESARGTRRGARELWKSEEAGWDLSLTSSMSADSQWERPFSRRNWKTERSWIPVAAIEMNQESGIRGGES